jgi:hypothetical protein
MMGTVVVIFWRDIPSQVVVREGRKTAKRELSDRFIRAIDVAAMHARATSEDAYLADWRRSDPSLCDGDVEAIATEVVARLEREYDTHRLAMLAKHDGREP